jgi:putative polyhydroxyalkanoate system protein
MANIQVTQAHTMPMAQAKIAAQKVADGFAEKFDITSTWKGDVLHFKRSGVDGTLKLGAKDAKIDIKLGFMLGLLSGRIETEAKQMMKDVFTA